MIVGLRDEAVDGDLEFDDAAEDTALQSLLGEFGEEAFYGIQPRARGRWKAKRGCLSSHCLTFGCL